MPLIDLRHDHCNQKRLREDQEGDRSTQGISRLEVRIDSRCISSGPSWQSIKANGAKWQDSDTSTLEDRYVRS